MFSVSLFSGLNHLKLIFSLFLNPHNTLCYCYCHYYTKLHVLFLINGHGIVYTK